MWCPFICRINDFNPSTRASLAFQRKYVLKTEARTLLNIRVIFLITSRKVDNKSKTIFFFFFSGASHASIAAQWMRV